MAIQYNQMSRDDEAIEAAKQALEIRPDSPNAVMMIAMSYISKRDKESARKYLPRLKELDEDLAKVLEKALEK
jgi:Flp pilus assembly protein TadD